MSLKGFDNKPSNFHMFLSFTIFVYLVVSRSCNMVLGCGASLYSMCLHNPNSAYTWRGGHCLEKPKFSMHNFTDKAGNKYLLTQQNTFDNPAAHKQTAYNCPAPELYIPVTPNCPNSTQHQDLLNRTLAKLPVSRNMSQVLQGASLDVGAL